MNLHIFQNYQLSLQRMVMKDTIGIKKSFLLALRITVKITMSANHCPPHGEAEVGHVILIQAQEQINEF